MAKNDEKPYLERTYESAEELWPVVLNYFADVEKRGILPDYAGMKLAIGVKSEKRIQEYCKDPDFKDIFEWAKLRRESFLVRTMSLDNKRANGCYNALKQEANGGYTDKPTENTERKIVIDLKGVGENAYK